MPKRWIPVHLSFYGPPALGRTPPTAFAACVSANLASKRGQTVSKGTAGAFGQGWPLVGHLAAFQTAGKRETQGGSSCAPASRGLR